MPGFICLFLDLNSLSCRGMGFPGGSDGKESACNAEDIKDLGLITGLERSPGEWNGYPL